MYPGGAQGFRGHTPEEEEYFFFEGYGEYMVDSTAIAYYRFERIVEDLAIYAEELLLSEEGGEDRPESLRYAMGNFQSGSTVERAYTALAATNEGVSNGQ